MGFGRHSGSGRHASEIRFRRRARSTRRTSATYNIPPLGNGVAPQDVVRANEDLTGGLIDCLSAGWRTRSGVSGDKRRQHLPLLERDRRVDRRSALSERRHAQLDWAEGRDVAAPVGYARHPRPCLGGAFPDARTSCPSGSRPSASWPLARGPPPRRQSRCTAKPSRPATTGPHSRPMSPAGRRSAPSPRSIACRASVSTTSRSCRASRSSPAALTSSPSPRRNTPTSVTQTSRGWLATARASAGRDSP
ncbi:hypothetical protein EV668_0066 [Enterovirga rhinocerotis]|uniref:Uncharacterized protein n=1 Tax=Enterovirga rhinocerotis TaxID=1339210 RepID=A0A4R7CAZ1_9HYPH|nr:hypothetical protein EV668_0066 [Enterovirga rhinocerotis]